MFHFTEYDNKLVYLSKLSHFKITLIVNISRVGLKEEWPDEHTVLPWVMSGG